MDREDFTINVSKHSRLLEPGFSKRHHVTLEQLFSALSRLSSDPQFSGQPDVVLSEPSFVSHFARQLSASEESTRHLLRGVALDRKRAEVAPDPLQYSRGVNRLLYRPFCRFDCDSMPMVAWGCQPLRQSLKELPSAISLQSFPDEWKFDGYKEALGTIALKRGKWFERYVVERLRRKIPAMGPIKRLGEKHVGAVGDIDLIAYLPWSRQLIVADCKSIRGEDNSSTAAEHVIRFVLDNSEYRQKLRRKAEWVRTHLSSVRPPLQIPDETPLSLVSGFVTQYPSLAALFTDLVFVLTISQLDELVDSKRPLEVQQAVALRQPPVDD